MMPNRYKSIALVMLCGVLYGMVGGGCARAAAPQRFTDFSLGTAITITFYDGRRSRNARTAQRLFSYAQDIERRMSTSQDDYHDTELLQSNRNAGLRPTLLSADTFAVVQEGVRLSQLTDGAFQIGIWPLTRLWDFSELIADDADLTAASAADNNASTADTTANAATPPLASLASRKSRRHSRWSITRGFG